MCVEESCFQLWRRTLWLLFRSPSPSPVPRLTPIAQVHTALGPEQHQQNIDRCRESSLSSSSKSESHPNSPRGLFFFLRWGGGVSKRDVLILQPSKSNRILSEIFTGIPECKLTVLIMTFPLWDHLGDSLSYLVSCSSLTWTRCKLFHVGVT